MKSTVHGSNGEPLGHQRPDKTFAAVLAGLDLTQVSRQGQNPGPFKAAFGRAADLKKSATEQRFRNQKCMHITVAPC